MKYTDEEFQKKREEIKLTVQLLSTQLNRGVTILEVVDYLYDLKGDPKPPWHLPLYRTHAKFMRRLLREHQIIKKRCSSSRSHFFALPRQAELLENLDSKILPKESEKMTPQPALLPKATEQGLVCSNPQPLISAIFEALEQEIIQNPEGVTVQILARHFPNASPEIIRPRLAVMESEGMIKSAKIGQSRFYMPVEKTAYETPLERPRKEVKRILGFACEICDDFVPTRAQQGLRKEYCKGCDAYYVIEGREAFRLGPPLKIRVWEPSNNE